MTGFAFSPAPEVSSLDLERKGSPEVASAPTVPCPLPSSLDPGTTDRGFCPQISLWAEGYWGAERWWLLQSPCGYSCSYEWLRLLGQGLISYLYHLSDFPGCSPTFPGMSSLLNVFIYLFTHPIAHYLTLLSVHLLTHPSIHPLTHLSTYSPIIHLPIYLFITITHSFIHLLPIHPMTDSSNPANNFERLLSIRPCTWV